MMRMGSESLMEPASLPSAPRYNPGADMLAHDQSRVFARNRRFAGSYRLHASCAGLSGVPA
jgi:hypothetical protein